MWGAQVGRESPSELKAAKLARSMARGVEDRDLRPNTRERAQIEAVITAPPNRCACSGDPSLHPLGPSMRQQVPACLDGV